MSIMETKSYKDKMNEIRNKKSSERTEDEKVFFAFNIIIGLIWIGCKCVAYAALIFVALHYIHKTW